MIAAWRVFELSCWDHRPAIHRRILSTSASLAIETSAAAAISRSFSARQVRSICSVSGMNAFSSGAVSDEGLRYVRRVSTGNESNSTEECCRIEETKVESFSYMSL